MLGLLGWDVYSFLKKVNGVVSMEQLESEFRGISSHELSEGILEYNMMARNTGIFSPFSPVSK